ncbi:MAG: DUF5337 domain-containing protein [Roseobacter sp.]
MSAQEQSAEARERALDAKGRTVSLVIVATMLVWLVVQFWLGEKLGLTLRYTILIDLLAMAALAWSFIVSWQIKRARKAARAER